MGRIMRRLESGERWWAAEIVLRAFGLGLLGLCAASALWLLRLVHQPPPHEARSAEDLAALLVCVGWSLGWCFLAEGPGLFKLVDLPERHGRFTL